MAPANSETSTLLVNAIFKSYNKGLIGAEIQTGDRELVSNSDVVISQNNIIRQGAQDYIVVSVDVRSPVSDVLVYIAQCRAQ